MTVAAKISLSVILAAVLLGVVVTLAGVHETARAASEVGFPAFALTGAILFGLMACQAAAWAALEKRLGSRVRFRTLFSSSIIAMAGNVLIPSSHLGGEPAKILYAGKQTGLPYTELAGTVLLCKYIEAMSFVLVLVFSTAVALAGFRQVLFGPTYFVLGWTIAALTAGALLIGVILWTALLRKWAPFTAIVRTVGRLGIKRPFFQQLQEKSLRMELHASQMFRAEGTAVLPAFAWYVLTHLAMYIRPLAFFYLGWGIGLSLPALSLLFVASQVLLAVQFMPSGVGTLDGGMLAIVSILPLGISVPQCTAFLLAIRFWDAAVVGLGAVIAARAGMGPLGKKAPADAASSRQTAP